VVINLSERIEEREGEVGWKGGCIWQIFNASLTLFLDVELSLQD
jgi:hypothetical protein